jgi:predicted RNA-binding Zn-ribbon protein involved in translation (DUF1610 family)
VPRPFSSDNDITSPLVLKSLPATPSAKYSLSTKLPIAYDVAMGETYNAICNACGRQFEVNEGGGFFFHMLRCDRCGKEKSLSFDRLGEAHLKYVKGLDRPHSEATRFFDEKIQASYPGAPLTEEEYFAIVEEIAGDHECGGHFTMTAPARCPKCGAEDIRKDRKAPTQSYD